MEITEAKAKFIQNWGLLGSTWGINRTMAQVHALLLISVKPLSADEIMAELQISRGNTNMNVRALIDWGLVYREMYPGDRKEYFRAEQDMYRVAKQIIRMRKQKELDPILQVISSLKKVEPDGKEETAHFSEMMENIEELSSSADSMLSKMLAADESWLGKTLIKFLK